MDKPVSFEYSTRLEEYKKNNLPPKKSGLTVPQSGRWNIMGPKGVNFGLYADHKPYPLGLEMKRMSVEEETRQGMRKSEATAPNWAVLGGSLLAATVLLS